MARIVARTGATVDSFEGFFVKNESHSTDLVDIGVLRFPDPEHPYLQVSDNLLRFIAVSHLIRRYIVSNFMRGLVARASSSTRRTQTELLEVRKTLQFERLMMD